MHGFSPDDYPGVPDSHFTEGDAIRDVKGVLEKAGFLVQETDARFDKGVDLLVAPTHMGAALPAIAAIQVKGGTSQSADIGEASRTGTRNFWRARRLAEATSGSSGNGCQLGINTCCRARPELSSAAKGDLGGKFRGGWRPVASTATRGRDLPAPFEPTTRSRRTPGRYSSVLVVPSGW